MKNGIFYFPELNEENVRPAAFGYWALRWSDEYACDKLEELMESNIAGSTSYVQSYLTRLQLLALYTASYWAYAIFILNVPADYIEEIRTGMNDAIKEYKGPDRGPISEQFISAYNSFFQWSFQSIGEDIKNIENSEPDVFNPDISNMSKYFIEAIEHYHFKNGEVMPEIEKTYIGHLVAEIPLKMFSLLNRQGVAFNA